MAKYAVSEYENLLKGYREGNFVAIEGANENYSGSK